MASFLLTKVMSGRTDDLGLGIGDFGFEEAPFLPVGFPPLVPLLRAGFCKLIR